MVKIIVIFENILTLITYFFIKQVVKIKILKNDVSNFFTFTY